MYLCVCVCVCVLCICVRVCVCCVFVYVCVCVVYLCMCVCVLCICVRVCVVYLCTVCVGGSVGVGCVLCGTSVQGEYIYGFHSIFHHRNWREKDHVMQSAGSMVM